MDEIKIFRYDRMRSRREQLGLKQLDLANMTGIAPNRISLYETGKATPTIETLASICKVLEVSPGYLLDLTTDPLDGIELSPIERTILKALRRGDIRGAIKSIVEE